MKNITFEQVVLIAMLERMLQKGLMDKEDVLHMRNFSMNLLGGFAEQPSSEVVDSAYQVSKEVGDFFEGFLRSLRR